MTARRSIPLLFALLVGCSPEGCDDRALRQAERNANEAKETVAKIQETVGGLERRLASLEQHAKAEMGPTQEDLAGAISAIDATSRAPGVFKSTYAVVDSTKLGNGNWQVIFGKKDGTGPRLAAIVMKTAVGWKWDGQPPSVP